MARPRVLAACGNPKCGISTGICGSLTFGYGELDDWGYWEHGCQTCARANDAKREQTEQEIVSHMQKSGSTPEQIKNYLAHADWLYQSAWPGKSEAHDAVHGPMQTL